MSTKLKVPTLPPDVPNVMLRGFLEALSVHRCYVMSLTRVVEGGIPGDDLLAGWKFVGRMGPNSAITTTVNQDKDGRLSFGGVTCGEQMVDALKAAEEIERRDDGLLDGDYEVAFLRIPGLLTESLWLRAEAGTAGGDWIVPYDSRVSSLKTNTAYSMQDFLTLVGPDAKQGLTFPVPPEPSSYSATG